MYSDPAEKNQMWARRSKKYLESGESTFYVVCLILAPRSAICCQARSGNGGIGFMKSRSIEFLYYWITLLNLNFSCIHVNPDKDPGYP